MINIREDRDITAVIGTTAAGKDELAGYLARQYGAAVIDLGPYARELARQAEDDQAHIYYDVSARNLAGYGPEFVLQQLAQEIKEDACGPVVITGVRTLAEIAVLKANFGSELLLVCVKVGDSHTRFERVRERNLPSDPDTYREFIRLEAREESVYLLSEAAGLADLTLRNNESLESYYRQIEASIVPRVFVQDWSH